MHNTTIQRDFDRIAEVSTGVWDHNMVFHKYLARLVPPGGRVLDIGCGTGEFTRIVAGRSTEVLGIDISPVMIETAVAKSRGFKNIEYRIEDVFETPEDKPFDTIVTIAAMHHLLPDVLPKVKTLLKPGGWFIVLDLFKEESITDYLMSAVSVPGNVLTRLIRTGRLELPPEEKEAWEEHAQHDHFMTIKELCSVYRGGLGTEFVLRRHLFWRYSLRWQKPDLSVLNKRGKN